MAQEQVQGILDALKLKQQRISEGIRASQQGQQIANEQQARQAQIDLEHEKLDQQAKYQDLTLKAAKALQDIQVMHGHLAIAAAPYSAVRGLPGATEAPATQTTHVTPGMHIENTDPNNVLLSVPGLGTILHPNAQGELANKTAEAQAAQAPLTAAKLAEIDAGKQADLLHEQLRQEAENARNETTRRSQELIGRGHDAARLESANIAHGADLDPNLVDSHTQDILAGNESLESLNKAPIGKGNKLAVAAAVAKAGGALPAQKQLDSVAAFAPVGMMIPKIQELNELLKNNPQASRIIGMDAYKRRIALQDELDQIIPNVARVIASDTGRLSNQQIQMAKAAAEPSANFLSADPASNFKKAKDFLGVVHAAIDARLSNLPKTQRDAIKARMGIPTFSDSTPVPTSAPTGPTILKFDAQGNPIQ